MSRLSAHSTVVASTTVSAVLALCILGVGATAPAAASSLTSATTVGDEAATSVNIAAAIGASLDAGTQAGARTGGGFTRSFGTSATAPSSTDSAFTGLAGTAQFADIAKAFDTGQTPSTTSGLSALSADTVFAAAGSAPTAAATPFIVPSLEAPAGPSVVSVAAPVVAAAAPAPAAVRARVVKAAPASPVGSPRQVAQSLAAKAGWSGAQWTCLSSLWQRESLFRTTARNSRSGAYGIPQALPASKMATAGADWRTNPATQVKWGLHYIATRYGNPCNAWAHWKNYRSY